MLRGDCADRAIPDEAVQAMAAARECLGASLVGAYLHGSAVAGGLRLDSDVDLLLVVDRPIPDQIRPRFLTDLMRVSGTSDRRDVRRPLELIVFNAADLERLSYPVPSEFVYGEWLRSAFESGSVPQPETSPEFTVLIEQTRRAALTLAGPPPQHLLPAIPDELLRCAIGDARQELLATLEGDERNVLLTLARMWYTLETGEIVPKDVAALWATLRLSEAAAAVMDRARLAYLGLAEDEWSGQRSQVMNAACELNDRLAALLRQG